MVWSPTCSLVFVSDVFVQSVCVLMLTLSAKRNEIFIVLSQIPDPTSFPGPHLPFATQCIYIYPLQATPPEACIYPPRPQRRKDTVHITELIYPQPLPGGVIERM